MDHGKEEKWEWPKLMRWWRDAVRSVVACWTNTISNTDYDFLSASWKNSLQVTSLRQISTQSAILLEEPSMEQQLLKVSKYHQHFKYLDIKVTPQEWRRGRQSCIFQSISSSFGDFEIFADLQRTEKEWIGKLEVGYFQKHWEGGIDFSSRLQSNRDAETYLNTYCYLFSINFTLNMFQIVLLVFISRKIYYCVASP